MKIVLSAALIALLMGCSDESSATKTTAETQTVAPIVKEVKVVEKKVVAPVVKEVKKVEKQVEEKVVVPVKKEVKQVEEKTVAKVEKVEAKVDGAKLFTTKCSSCHGENAENKALNKSQVIQGWSVAKVTTAINGYKDGTYGSSMKGVMKSQVSKLTKNEIKALGEYISKL